MSRRIEKINELLKQEISNLILREFDFSRETIVTIIKTQTSSDLQQTKVWISVLPFSRAETVLGVLNSHNYNIQKLLNFKLKIKVIPRIIFKLDESEEKASHVKQLLKNI